MLLWPMTDPILWPWPMPPLLLCARTSVGAPASKNRVRNMVATFFIAFTSNGIEACNSDSLSVRLRSSHTAGVAYFTAPVRSAVRVIPVAVRIHPVIAAREARHRFLHHLRLRWPLVAPHPDRLLGFHQYFISGMELIRHADQALAHTHLGIPGPFHRNTENGSPHG